MSSIPQTTDNGNSVSDFATKFMKRFHLGKLLFKCNAGKEKGIPVMDVFCFLFCMMFSDRSFYMQMKTGTFGEGFSKNTIYRFLNNARTNWQRFTTLLSAAEDKNLLCEGNACDGRSPAGRRRLQTRRKATDVMVELIHSARCAGITARYVLFDSWFSAPKTMIALKNQEHPDTIAMVKKSRTKYLYNGEKLNVKEIYSRNKKRRGCSRYLLSVSVTVEKEGESIPAKFVYVRNKSKRKDWLVIVSTDTELSEEEIIRVYGKRRDIEVFFKACKSCLNLVKEYRGISYDAMNAHVAIVFSRYMMLSVARRENTDDKTMCELCFCLLDEMEDIMFSRSMHIIIDALMDTVMEYFHITEARLDEFTVSFIQRLPKYMQEALERKEVAA